MSTRALQAIARDKLERFIAERDDQSEIVSEARVRSLYPDTECVGGWRLRLDPVGGEATLVDLLTGSDYPFDKCWIGIAALPPERRPQLGVIQGDVLCIEGPRDPLPVSLEPDAVADLLERARVRLGREKPPITSALALNAEIVDYWGSRRVPGIDALLDPGRESRRVVYQRTPSGALVAETDHQLRERLKRMSLRPARSTHGTVVLDLPLAPGLLFTNAELHAFVRTHAPGSLPLLESISTATVAPVPIVLRVPTPDGMALLGAWIADPTVSRRGLERSIKWDGLRPGSDVVSRLAPRVFARETRLRRARVQRVDTAWLFQRGGGGFSERLLQSRVVVIGVGSLGSTIARRLVKAGVGTIELIDPDILTIDNIARHELGARFVGSPKARSLAAVLGADFLHLTVRGHAARWETVWSRMPAVLSGADLIISTIADWRSEAHLNAILRTEPSFPAVLFTWLEDRAAAAQALLVATQGGCLACGMDRWGTFAERVVAFNNEMRVPGCDAFYQPYSAMDAEQGASIATELALESLEQPREESRLVTWVGARRVLDENNGRIREAWLEKHGETNEGRVRLERAWSKSVMCGYCS